ncbi:MAG: DEAD/DEAH box helicase, partial [Salinisphaera sp.]|nr:DEAD/DEAH box helicase [Salinisphaera sp.]
MSFASLGLNPQLLGALARADYQSPTPIQSRAIPAVLAGHDLLAAAQTGTGKTAAFTLPILEQLTANPRAGKNPRVLILTPTRELAAQVLASVQSYGQGMKQRSLAVFGGVNANPQIRTLNRGCDILVATPGRLLDLANQGHANLRQIEIFVMDEADRMLDMGFIHDIKRIIKLLPPQRQNLMFSATFSPEIRDLAKRIVANPV